MYLAKLLKMCCRVSMRPANAKDASMEVNRSKLKAILVARVKIPSSSPSVILYHNIEAHTSILKNKPRSMAPRTILMNKLRYSPHSDLMVG